MIAFGMRDLNQGQSEYRLVNAELATMNRPLITSSWPGLYPLRPGKSRGTKLPLEDVEIALSPRELRFFAFENTGFITMTPMAAGKISGLPGHGKSRPMATGRCLKKTITCGCTTWPAVRKSADDGWQCALHIRRHRHRLWPTRNHHPRGLLVAGLTRVLTVIKDNRQVKVGPA